MSTALLVVGFALVGETLLGRRSTDLFGWSQSLLIGMGICAAALFPLSLTLPGKALEAELALMILAALATAARRLQRRAGNPPRVADELRAIGTDGIALALLVSILLVVLLFGALNLWSGHLWDSIQVWGTRAKLLFVQGGLTRSWFPEDPYDSRLLGYPPLVSLFEALLCRLRGTFDFDLLKPIFFPFYVSMLLSTYTAARMLCSTRWALSVTLGLALLPEVSGSGAIQGYVDMPLAAFVSAVVATSLCTDRENTGWNAPLAWLIGGLTTVKQEGMLLALMACSGVLLYWVRERPRRLALRLRTEWPGAAVVLAFIAARVLYLRWLNIHDTTWGTLDAYHLTRALKNLGLVASLCLRFLLDPQVWGLFWPAFFLASVWIAVSGLTRPTCLAVATGATVVLYGAIFLMTNWSFEQHIAGAYTRLLAQLAPAAAVVIGAAANRIWSPVPASSEGPPAENDSLPPPRPA